MSNNYGDSNGVLGSMKVKHFYGHESLDDKINRWLESQKFLTEIIDIKFSVHDVNAHVLIIYRVS
ncbi:hypothetical protein BpsS140_00005 [Bacillus phage vB_BpsS-140]|nr:hypothetical protein BpsS140_00005 [Bacillus phage vB_BpsS-140]